MEVSRELRVFISSTFRDLEEERNYLSKKIFPAIRALCRDRGVEFTEIDLRWGLTDDEAHNGLVIRSCLEEIDRCRPYFIGIVGSRYGWVPEHHIIQRDPELLHRYSWIEDAATEGKSIIEMEFDYGALNDPQAAQFAFFYLPHHVHSDRVDQPEKLDVLKDRIRASGLPCHEYRSAASLGEQILRDLTQTVNSQWPVSDEVTPLERERKQHQAFAANRRHAYIANPHNIHALTDYAKSAINTPLGITAPSGTGKSALLAYWTNLFQRRNPQTLIIEHYIGVSSRGNDEHAVLSHIVEEIKARFQLDTPIPASSAELVADLPLWLSRAQGDVVIVIDALNQLDGTPHRLAWIPEHLPEHVKMILSTTDPSMLTAGFARLELAALTIPEREAIIVRFLGEFHKSLAPNEARLIANDKKTESPLFLRTLLEEIRLFGSHHDLIERIKLYLSCSDLRELFQRVLERMEVDYGPHIVRDIMTVIWASRRGLTEAELEQLVHATPEHLGAVVLALDYHLLRREARLAFFHEYLREAVELRYLGQPEKKKKAHKHIAEYLSSHTSPERRAEEEPWQWQQAEEWERLRDTLTNFSLFPYLGSKENQYALLGFWRSLKGRYDITCEYDKALTTEQDISDERRMLSLLASFYIVSGLYDDAEKIYQQAIQLSGSGPSSVESAELKEQLAEVLYHKSKYEEASSLYQEAADIYEKLKGTYDRSRLIALNGLGLSLLKLGKQEQALSTLEYCSSLYEQHYKTGSPDVIPLMLNLAFGYYRMNQDDRAIALMRKTLDIITKQYGSSSTECIVPLNNLGAMLRRAGNHIEAQACYERAMALSSTYLGRHHPLSLFSYYNLGVLYFFEKRYAEYLDIFRTVFLQRLRLLGITHQETLVVLQFLCEQCNADPALKTAAQEFLTLAQNAEHAESVKSKLQSFQDRIYKTE